MNNFFAIPRFEAMHINVAEIMAIWLSVKQWSAQWTGARVTVHTDNTTACSGLSKQRVRVEGNRPLLDDGNLEYDDDDITEPDAEWLSIIQALLRACFGQR
ncbi:hypothetical protein AC579_8973 [Pseudocercospora musae]|uniref:Uncharacterized protein n=1 Tax=Pseudocercospora musae TaxID=113226 RepID=A0A139HNT3_9PEZI|nr:hypothetical protein AC579_8973 [Pseudocercospora musae]